MEQNWALIFRFNYQKNYWTQFALKELLQLRSDSRTIYSLVFYCTKFLLLNAIFHTEGYYVKLVNSVKC